jgi:hypothetical protein
MRWDFESGQLTNRQRQPRWQDQPQRQGLKNQEEQTRKRKGTSHAKDTKRNQLGGS